MQHSGWSYIPEKFSIFYGTPVWDRLGFEQKSCFARNWVEHAMPKMGRMNRLLLSETAERITTGMLKAGLRAPYTQQLAPHVSYEEFKACLRSEHRRAMFSMQARPTVEQLVELGIVRRKAVRGWESTGLLQGAAA